jgi:hypothetical protein
MKNENKTMLRLDWPVDQHGYEFVEFPEERLLGYSQETFLDLSTFIQGRGGPLSEYSPFSGKFAPHRELANLDENISEVEGVLDFCGKYGLLDHSLPENHPRIERSPKGGTKLRQRPTGEFMQVQELLALEGFWFYQRDVRQAILALERGDKLEAIRLFNLQTISVVPKIQVVETRLNHPWKLIPRTLISAIWLLIEAEISGGTQWRRCKTCQGWFVPKTARKLYCKDACKSARYRKSKKGV